MLNFCVFIFIIYAVGSSAKAIILDSYKKKSKPLVKACAKRNNQPSQFVSPNKKVRLNKIRTASKASGSEQHKKIAFLYDNDSICA